MTDATQDTAATKVNAPTDPLVFEVRRVADAVFSLKNVVMASSAVTNAVLLKLEHFMELNGGNTSAGGIVSVQVPATGAAATPPAATPAVVDPPSTTAVISSSQLFIAVGPTRAIKEPADALQYLAPGGMITCDDATYLKPFHNTVPGLVIASASGFPRRCVFDGQRGHGGGHNMAYRKGFIHSGLPVAIKRIGFVRCGGIAGTDEYSNEAAIWLGDSGGDSPTPTDQHWSVSVVECTFDDCGDGIFTSTEPGLDLTVTGNIFGVVSPNGMNAAAAGLGPHPAHDIYFEGGSIDVGFNMFFGSVGHNVKTRSARAIIHDNPLMCQDGGRVLDAAEGGIVAFLDNKVWTRTDRQGISIGTNTGAFGNSNLLAYAGENINHGTPGLTMGGNTFNVSRPGSTIMAGFGSTITSTNDTVAFFGQGSLVAQGNVVGLAVGSAPPGAGNPPPLPTPPAWSVA